MLTKRKAMALAVATTLLFSLATMLYFVKFASAQDFEGIIIKADGSVDPPTALIQRDGDVYTLVGDIDDYVLLERNHTIFDGAGHTIGGICGPLPVQVDFEWQVNATTDIKIVNAVVHKEGIFFFASYNSIFANNTLNNSTGLDCRGDGNVIANNTVNGGRGIAGSGNGNVISGNHLTNCNYTFVPDNPRPYGIIVGGSNNTVFGNFIVGTNGTGISLGTSFNNTIVGNQIEDNVIGLLTRTIFSQGGAHDNLIYYNNFINNTDNIYNEVMFGGPVAVSIWDNGVVGNYWSDYSGADADSNGIGDTPYVIDESNQDNFPLMTPVDIIPSFPSPPVPEFSSLILLATLTTAFIGVGLFSYFKKRKR